jgi:hypothetical protein
MTIPKHLLDRVERVEEQRRPRKVPIYIVGCDRAECEEQLAERRTEPGFDETRVRFIYTGVMRSNRGRFSGGEFRN